LPAEGQEQPFAGLDGRGPSPATGELVDTEARKIVEECYAEAMQTLQSHRDQLDRLAHTLLERESLNEDEAYAAAGVPRTTGADLPSPTAAPRS
jgi:cell division protease FtsH